MLRRPLEFPRARLAFLPARAKAPLRAPAPALVRAGFRFLPAHPHPAAGYWHESTWLAIRREAARNLRLAVRRRGLPPPPAEHEGGAGLPPLARCPNPAGRMLYAGILAPRLRG